MEREHSSPEQRVNDLETRFTQITRESNTDERVGLILEHENPEDVDRYREEITSLHDLLRELDALEQQFPVHEEALLLRTDIAKEARTGNSRLDAFDALIAFIKKQKVDARERTKTFQRRSVEPTDERRRERIHETALKLAIECLAEESDTRVWHEEEKRLRQLLPHITDELIQIEKRRDIPEREGEIVAHFLSLQERSRRTDENTEPPLSSDTILPIHFEKLTARNRAELRASIPIGEITAAVNDIPATMTEADRLPRVGSQKTFPATEEVPAEERQRAEKENKEFELSLLYTLYDTTDKNGKRRTNTVALPIGASGTRWLEERRRTMRTAKGRAEVIQLLLNEIKAQLPQEFRDVLVKESLRTVEKGLGETLWPAQILPERFSLQYLAYPSKRLEELREQQRRAEENEQKRKRMLLVTRGWAKDEHEAEKLLSAWRRLHFFTSAESLEMTWEKEKEQDVLEALQALNRRLPSHLQFHAEASSGPFEDMHGQTDIRLTFPDTSRLALDLKIPKKSGRAMDRRDAYALRSAQRTRFTKFFDLWGNVEETNVPRIVIGLDRDALREKIGSEKLIPIVLEKMILACEGNAFEDRAAFLRSLS